jgi:membrane protease YdiL (CAAX protease family)
MPSTRKSDHVGKEVLAYFLAAIGFTWAIHFSIIVFSVPFSMDLSTPGMKLYLLGLAGPLVGSVAVSTYTAGLDGVKGLLSKALIWRFPLTWYLIAILLIPAINLTNILVFYDRVPDDFAWFAVIPVLIVGQIWVVVAEEFGWRGFALPRLQARYGSLGATLVLGSIWAIWHLPMFFVPGSPQYSENVPASLAVYTIVTVCLSILLTVIYNRSHGSVLSCMLFHAFLNIAAFTIRIPPDINISIYMICGVAVLAIGLLDRPLFRRPDAGVR